MFKSLKMALGLEIAVIPTTAIKWKIETPFPGRESSDFTIMGATWHLQFLSMYSFRFETVLHSVHLIRRDDEFPIIPFQVTCHVKTNLDNCDYTSHCCVFRVDSAITVIWIHKESMNTIRDFQRCKELEVVCTFNDSEPSDSRIKNEKIDVTTQTDFDRLLPAKNLPYNELTSNGNEQADSWVSSNLDSLSHDLGKLLQEKILPDVKLRCGDRTVAAHKAVLAARSEVFAAMFQSKMLESETGEVDITDVDAEVLEWFMKYAYTGRLFDLPDDDLPGLYSASDKYAINALKKACSERIISRLSAENYLNFLLLADSHSDQDIRSAILEFIQNHLELLKSQEWTKFRKENPTLCCDIFQVVLEKNFI